ncbi:MAG: hypothetical protein HYR85_02165 [Planctomycetes bacterium]|nr:hypothetical protein [Planctomycetota bacterium]MBI3848398.1 hypothetical protein [Planctomycetota bacterium]
MNAKANRRPSVIVNQSKLDQPIGVAEGAVAFSYSASVRWPTPGALLAEALKHQPHVTLVMERLERHRYSVFVILDDDPESLLDDVFAAEKHVMKSFKGLPFDMRVMKPRADWKDEDLRRDCIVHHERSWFEVRSH